MTESMLLDPRVEGEFVIRTDPHCHILPGLDDGARDLEMSLRMARRMEALGIKRVVATPHGVHPGIETNTNPEFLREQVGLLNEVLVRAGIDLKVLPGTEVFLRRRVRDRFERGEIMTWADQGRFILMELGFQRRSEGALEVVDYFLEAGIITIIAHPERYLWLANEPELFAELRDRGCIFQFNTMSINGFFGERTQEMALRMLPLSGQFIIGTDSHHDADRYFDFENVKTTLRRLNLETKPDHFSAPPTSAIPDFHDLSL